MNILKCGGLGLEESGLGLDLTPGGKFGGRSGGQSGLLVWTGPVL